MSAPAAVVQPVFTGTVYCQSTDFQKDGPDGPNPNGAAPRGNASFVSGSRSADGVRGGRYPLEVTINGIAGSFPLGLVAGKNYIVTITEAPNASA